MMSNLQILRTKDLATLLGVSEVTIRRRLCYGKPDDLPPRINIPGRANAWLFEDYVEWLKGRRILQSGNKRGRGRPRKIDQVLRCSEN